jgi:hypothetical protein
VGTHSLDLKVKVAGTEERVLALDQVDNAAAHHARAAHGNLKDAHHSRCSWKLS